MKISFKVNRKITYNGKEYASVDELPETVRHAYENAMGTGTAGETESQTSKLRLIVNGKEYSSVEEMPAEIREAYQTAMSAVPGKSVVLTAEINKEAIDLVRAAGGEKVGLFRRMFPRTLLRWMEPKEFQRIRYEADKRRLMQFLPVVVIICCAAIFAMGRAVPYLKVGPLYVVAAFVVGMIAFLTLVNQGGPTSISITDTAIVRGFGRSATLWHFAQIDHCEIVSKELSGVRYSVLVVETRFKRRSEIGIDPSLALAELQLMLEGKGVKVLMQVQ
jgi:hypothetical protein